MSPCTELAIVSVISFDVGQMSRRIDLVAGLVLAERLREQVDVHPAGQRVGDDERRRGEVVRLHLGMDPGLEVAVAREHGADDQVALLDGDRDLFRQRA